MALGSHKVTARQPLPQRMAEDKQRTKVCSASDRVSMQVSQGKAKKKML